MLRPTKNPLSAKNTSRQKIPPQNSITFGFIPMENNPECPIQTRTMAATRAISRPRFLVLLIELPLCWIFLPTIAWERKCVKQGAEEHRIHGIFIFIKIDQGIIKRTFPPLLSCGMIEENRREMRCG